MIPLVMLIELIGHFKVFLAYFAKGHIWISSFNFGSIFIDLGIFYF